MGVFDRWRPNHRTHVNNYGGKYPSYCSITSDTRATARSFVRTLNILLKFVRLYEFGHVRTTAQFEAAWKELRAALDESGDTGLLLGASGNQILLDGVPLGAAAAERSFAQLLTASGIASIHFAPNTTQAQFSRLVRAFPASGTKASALAEQLKTALAGDTSIKINQIRFVAEDQSVAGIKVAAQLTAKMLGSQADKLRDIFEGPQKMLQLILAAESGRGGGASGAGFEPGPGGGGGSGTSSISPGSSWSGGTDSSGSLWEASKASGGGGCGGGGEFAGGTGSGAGGTGNGAGGAGGGGSGTSIGGGGTETGSGGPGGGGPGDGRPGGGGGRGGVGGAGGGIGSGAREPGKWMAASAMLRGSGMGGIGGAGGIGAAIGGGGEGSSYAVAEEEVRSMIGLFAQLGKARKDPASRTDAATFQSRLTALPVRAQYTLQQALAGLAAQAPMDKPDKPMLLKLAEHVAIRFALDSYERGELRVNAVKQLLDRMNAEIEALRKILSSQEELMASAGLQVQSYTELLDQEFWEQVPEENKKEVLTSDEAWCVPPRNVRGFLEEMLRRGELKMANEILMKYASCIG